MSQRLLILGLRAQWLFNSQWLWCRCCFKVAAVCSSRLRWFVTVGRDSLHFFVIRSNSCTTGDGAQFVCMPSDCALPSRVWNALHLLTRLTPECSPTRFVSSA